MKKVLIVFILIAIFISSCVSGTNGSETVKTSLNEQLVVINEYAVYRLVDKEAGVVCYLSSTIRTDSGIFCLPLSQTKLEQ